MSLTAHSCATDCFPVEVAAHPFQFVSRKRELDAQPSVRWPRFACSQPKQRRHR
jgi:hypothetical protein